MAGCAGSLQQEILSSAAPDKEGGDVSLVCPRHWLLPPKTMPLGALGAPSRLRIEVSLPCSRPSPRPFLHRGAVPGDARTTPAPRARGWHQEPRHQARGVAPRREHKETNCRGEVWRRIQPGLLSPCSAPRSACLPSLCPCAAWAPPGNSKPLSLGQKNKHSGLICQENKQKGAKPTTVPSNRRAAPGVSADGLRGARPAEAAPRGRSGTQGAAGFGSWRADVGQLSCSWKNQGSFRR